MTDEQTHAGHPVENSDDERLAFQNPKSGTIHLASRNPPVENGWSVCGGGGPLFRKDTTDVLYVGSDEISDGHLVQDGDIVGSICGNCLRRLDSLDS